MKQLIKTSILLLAILLPAIATAHDFKVDSIYYNRINSNEVEVTYGQVHTLRLHYAGTVTIPATVTYDGTTYSVTAIGDGAFLRCPGLTSVNIPNSVTSIGACAFCECTGLTSIVIPNSVTSIGYEAFMDCTGLTSIDIPNSVTAISSYAFYNTAWYNNQPDGLVYAGKVAYKYKGTMPSGTNMTLEEGTLGIAVCAFMDCPGLTSIVIPNSVTEVGVLAFMDCPGLTGIVVESGNPRYDSRNNCTAIIETASNTLIAGCKNTIIPNSVTAIGYGAFKNCTLTSIVIPNSITKIGELAFEGCESLTSIVI
ncbi:MAG: leucine-rich repeat protein, partial [Muribaculaceae bacterium]|nr:leucine-rich repeat protein [Muribaculaceae bacterium]